MKISKRFLGKSLIAFLLASTLALYAHAQHVHLKIITVSDLHATVFPGQTVNTRYSPGSLAQIKAYADSHRQQLGDNVILLDNGDLIQGQPTAYYHNFYSPGQEQFFARVMNYAGFDAATVGNHDIEAGWDVYNALKHEFQFPWLGANVNHIRTGLPYFEPYTIIEREGVRVAVLGLVTPSVPAWLPRKLWEGLEFVSMYSAAKYWMEHIQQNESPDVVIGLFHSGTGPDVDYAEDSLYLENASLYVARYVPGFDVIFTAHDHRVTSKPVENVLGEQVMLMGGASHGRSVAEVDLIMIPGESGGYTIGRTGFQIMEMNDYEPCPDFMEKFSEEQIAVKKFVTQKIGYLENTLRSRDGYWGSSAFTDFIHQVQLEITQADISFAAPLTFNTTLEKGSITMRDMFNLYPFENYLYVMEMNGQEIIDFLEYSYGLWFNTMTHHADHLVLLQKGEDGELQKGANQRARFRNAFFNFDSAAGIHYQVDVRKEPGQRVRILSMMDGTPFEKERHYKVAINSYRGSGGGGHLTDGVGIEHDMLEKRIFFISETDMRTQMAKYIKQKGTIHPSAFNNWKLIPERWVERAAQRDRKLLFGE